MVVGAPRCYAAAAGALDQAGLLLDVREPEAESEGYSFLPWSSIEQVKIREVAQRRVKFLQGG